ncbi:MAG: saccharopine dehydrogenase NADP-binding domain-containing protein [Bacteroidales bacterium]|jgi:saccharopine dehydrogenase-like NADP-dependent oxidoreductase|nr:saccharopine dehydrogenase NADP-binding domain-containing protein [Bacteroidales bacterium]
MKKVLILGAGLVAKPLVEYLLRKGFSITVASPMKDRADMMIAGNPNGTSVDWSMDEPAMLDGMVEGNDLTVSLLPYAFHTAVAKVCLRFRKHLVTTSYVQGEIEKMDNEARSSDLLFMNEIGLDPGIDHMTAMKVINSVHDKGGKIKLFCSICGALPAPEAADNPLGYRFSWSPKGVLLAGRNNALYLRNGKRVCIDTRDLFRTVFTYDFPGVGPLEAYPNRDSVSYAGIYGIPEVETMFRGTFRYKGWCETMDAMKRIDMFSDTVKDYTGFTLAGFVAERAGISEGDIRAGLLKKLGLAEGSAADRAFGFLGFFSGERLQAKVTTPFEITSDEMIRKMSMRENDRDMVALQHIFLAEYPGGKREVIKSSMLDFGSPATNTAIARTVGLPAAIAVKLILEDVIKARGVMRPVAAGIYEPVLAELSTLGIDMREEYGLPEKEIPVLP